MTAVTNKHYGQFPLLGYIPVAGFFAQRQRLVEIDRNIQEQIRIQSVDRNAVIIIDLSHKLEILQKGQKRSFLTIALCIVCIAANFYPVVFGVIGAVSIIGALAVRKCIEYNQKTLRQYQENPFINDTYLQLNRKMRGTHPIT